MKVPLMSLNEMLGFKGELHVKVLLIHKYTENLKYFHTLIYRVKINKTNALIWSVGEILSHKPEILLQKVRQSSVSNLPIYSVVLQQKQRDTDIILPYNRPPNV